MISTIRVQLFNKYLWEKHEYLKCTAIFQWCAYFRLGTAFVDDNLIHNGTNG